MVEKEFNFRKEIRKNPRIVNENDLQNMEYIELSYSGELIPVEEVEGIFNEFIKKLKEEFDLGTPKEARFSQLEIESFIDKHSG